MDSSFQEKISTANLFLQENELEKSIENYEEALKLSSTIEQKINLNNLLGRLFQKTKKPAKAIEQFEESIKLYEESFGNKYLADKAAIFNNLGAVYKESNVNLAIENYASALKIYTVITESGRKDYYPHLANTNVALAEAYNQKKDFYKAKNLFKAGIKLYNQLSGNSFDELKANAYYHLGNVYTDEFNLYDAKTSYLKSLKLYENLSLNKEENYGPFFAAIYNNLGVTFKSLDEPQKALEYFELAFKKYEHLAENSSALFLPYVAASLNGLSIVYAEIKNLDSAIEYSHKTITIYNDLADKFPQEYTHYLATSLHNLGLFYFELKDIDLAEKYFKQALIIRKNLAIDEPEAFDADVCVTSLNLVELYQAELESSLDFSFKTICIALLKDVDSRLKKYNENRPILKSMKSDCQYYLNYFDTISIEQITLNSVLKKVDNLTEEVNSTIMVKEKIRFQYKIVKILEEQYKQYSQNGKLKNELAYAYNDLSWLHLRSKNFEKAETIILKAQKLEQTILPLKCNLAHCYLLQGKFTKAKKIYLEFINEKNSKNQPFYSTVLSDFDKLINDGIHHKDFDKIKALLSK